MTLYRITVNSAHMFCMFNFHMNQAIQKYLNIRDLRYITKLLGGQYGQLKGGSIGLTKGKDNRESESLPSNGPIRLFIP